VKRGSSVLEIGVTDEEQGTATDINLVGQVAGGSLTQAVTPALGSMVGRPSGHPLMRERRAETVSFATAWSTWQVCDGIRG
jgi:hypothetical protein